MPQLIIIFGLIIFVIGGFWFLVVAFKQSVLWGIACLLLPIVPLIFTLVHWSEAKSPFFMQVVGFVLLLIGAFLGGYGIFQPH